MRLAAGYPMGPLELADYTGLDTKRAVMETLLRATGHPVFRPVALVERLVAEGRLGRKSGKGVYEY